MTTRRLDLPLISESQAGKYITHNQAMHLLDAWKAVISRTNSGPPASPTEGDSYIVDSATGAWSGFTVGDLAVYYLNSAGSAAWVNASPSTGITPYVEDESAYVMWVGGEWTLVASATTDVEVSSSRSIAATDANKILLVTAAATVTFEPDATLDLPKGTSITVRRDTSSAVTIAAGTGVTFKGAVTLSAEHDYKTLIKGVTDTWLAY